MEICFLVFGLKHVMFKKCVDLKFNKKVLERIWINPDVLETLTLIGKHYFEHYAFILDLFFHIF